MYSVPRCPQVHGYGTGKVPDCLDSPVHHHICDALGNLDRNGQHANLHVIFFHLLQKVVRMVDRNPVEVSADQSRVYIKSSHNLKPEMLQTGVLQKCASQTADSKRKALCISVNPRKCSKTSMSASTSYPTRVRRRYSHTTSLLLSVKRQYLFP